MTIGSYVSNVSSTMGQCDHSINEFVVNPLWDDWVGRGVEIAFHAYHPEVHGGETTFINLTLEDARALISDLIEAVREVESKEPTTSRTL
jgi:hypothetical protein